MAKTPICVPIYPTPYQVPADKYAVVTVQGSQSTASVTVQDQNNVSVGSFNVGHAGSGVSQTPSTGIVLPSGYRISSSVAHLCSGFLYDNG